MEVVIYLHYGCCSPKPCRLYMMQPSDWLPYVMSTFAVDVVIYHLCCHITHAALLQVPTETTKN